MGIRVFCPNGHKLNVKAFLAGKTGICPHCGSKFAIPADSPVDSTPAQDTAAPAAPTASTRKAAVAQAAAPVQAAQAAAPIAMPVAAAPAAQTDPFAEAPTAQWYMRPAAGGQYGPAAADVMRQWLDEGRVGADAYVWREGWPDWQSAATVFPRFQTAAVAAQPVAHEAAAATPATASSGAFDFAPELPRAIPKRTARKQGMAPGKLIAIAMAVLLVLLIVLVVVVVIHFQTKDKDKDKPKPKEDARREAGDWKPQVGDFRQTDFQTPRSM